MPELDAVDHRIINQIQGDFPLVERPFLALGQALDLSEAELIQRLGAMLAARQLTRFGPLFHIERMGGAFVLAAMAVPEARYDEVSALVNALNAVAHNYRREHRLNMWFVLATETREGIPLAIDTIETRTGLKVHAFPKEKEYFVEMKLPVRQGVAVTDRARPEPAPSTVPLPSPAPENQPPHACKDMDRALVVATQAGLPLTPRPYVALGAQLGIPAESVMVRLQAMLQRGVIRRIGAVPNHYAIGWTANGMTVWDVADERIDELGGRVGQLAFVTHCYRRPRALPDWPYNLFAMVHGSSRDEVAEKADTIRLTLGPHCRARDILYSTAILKKTGLRLGG